MYLAVFLILQVSGYMAALQWETVQLHQHGNFTIVTLLVDETMQALFTDCLCSHVQTSCDITHSNHNVTDVHLITDNTTSAPLTSHRKCSHTHESVVHCSPAHTAEAYCQGMDVNRTIQTTNYTCSGTCVNVIWILGDSSGNTTRHSSTITNSTSTCDFGCVAPTALTTTVSSISTSHRPFINVTVSSSGGGGNDDNIGVIVGAVLGVCATAFIVCMVIAVIYRRSKSQNKTQASVKENQNQNSSSQVPDNTLTYNSLYPETAASVNVAYSYSNLTDVEPRKENTNEYDTAYTDSDNLHNKNSKPDGYEYVTCDTDVMGYLVLDNTVTQTATTLNTRPKMPTIPVREETPVSQRPEDPQSEVEYENLQNDLYIDMSVHQPKLEDHKHKTKDAESLSSSSSSDSIYVNQNLP